VPSYNDYYPLTLGSYRTYVVQDSTWTAGKVTTNQYQLRERVSEQFTDATGQPAYRLVRSRRADASAAWADDSLLVVQPLPRALLLTRNNVRTVELIYPPQTGKQWNRTAFTVNGQAGVYTDVVDTITALNRYYGPNVGGAYTTPAAGPASAKSYDATVIVADKLPTQLNDGTLAKAASQQVFARGVGLVLRRRFAGDYREYKSNGDFTLRSTVQNGTSRRETLLETGSL
jgi:hypothetical protein